MAAISWTQATRTGLAGACCACAAGRTCASAPRRAGLGSSIGMQPMPGESDADFRARMAAADAGPGPTDWLNDLFAFPPQAESIPRAQVGTPAQQRVAALQAELEATKARRANAAAANAYQASKTAPTITPPPAHVTALREAEQRQRDQQALEVARAAQAAVAQRQEQRQAALDMGAPAGALPAGTEAAGGLLSTLTSTEVMAPIAVGGALLAAGATVYHAQPQDRVRSKATIKRKERQAIGTAAAGGAASGAAIGTMIFPGIGTAIGAGVGAIAGGAAGFFGASKLKKDQKKLRKREAATAAAIEAERQAEIAAAEQEAREEAAAAAQTRLALNAYVRDANRWLIAVQQMRGDAEAAALLRDEVVGLLEEASATEDLVDLYLLADQAALSVNDLKAMAAYYQANRGTRASLAGLGSANRAAHRVARLLPALEGILPVPTGLSGANEYVFEARAKNRAALGLPPQERQGGVSVSMAVGGAILGLGVLALASRR